MERSIPITIAAVILLAAPSAIAGWSVNGDNEPSTSFDVNTLMWPDPTVSGAGRVYFNAFTTSYAGLSVNPNVGTLGTRNEAVPIEGVYAILGVWRDCNGDGYIGMAEGLLREYDALLLTDSTICPPGTGHPSEWDGVSHNYNGWVTELIPIGNVDTDTEWDDRQFTDTKAMVWGDFGRPNDASELSGGGTCALFPAPRGTTQHTAGLINFAECNAPVGPMSAVNLVTADSYRIAGQDLEGPGDPLGIRFEEDEYGNLDADGHPFWNVSTFGDEDAEYSAVHAWDCTADPIRVGDLANDTAPGHDESVPDDTPLVNARAAVWLVHDVYQYPVSTNPVGNTENPTVAGTVNETWEGGFSDCDYSNDAGGDIYGAVEGDNNNAPLTGKTSADWNFEYLSGARGRYINFGEDLNGDGENETLDNPLRPGTAGQEGYSLGLGVSPTFYSGWNNNVALIKLIPNTVALRANLAEGSADPGPAAAYWMSFYAFVGSETTSKGFRLPGGSGKYGSAQCGLNTDGLHNGWECDADLWNLNADGTPVESTFPLAVPGSTYVLRDVDCYDGGTNLGVGIGIPYYGEQSCSA